MVSIAFFSRRFRRKGKTLTVASFLAFFRQFNAIGPFFVHFLNSFAN